MMAIVRRAKLRLSLAVLEDLIKGAGDRWAAVETDAPGDLSVLGVIQPPEGVGSWCYLIIESKSLRPVPEMAEPPEVGPFHYRTKEEVTR
jgi:hypothetical protein